MKVIVHVVTIKVYGQNNGDIPKLSIRPVFNYVFLKVPL